MLVVENRSRSTAAFIDVDDLLKEFVTRIKRLPFFIDRVVPVLANQQHAVDGKVVSTKRQCIGNGRRVLDRGVTTQPLAAQIVRSNLLDIQRDDVHRRTVVSTFPAVTFQEPIDDVLRMRILVEDRRHRRDLQAFFLSGGRGVSSHECSGRSGQKSSSRNRHAFFSFEVIFI